MNLNPRQEKAIKSNHPNILCLAAGGSGKTRVLSERVLRLLEEGVNPKSVVCITFTRMAAEEMRKRFGDRANGMFIGTIHSYANYLCTLNNIFTGTLLDNQEFDKLIEKALTLPQKRYEQIDHLLVDEFQDVSSLEFRFMERIPTKNRFYIGDNRQGIYGFKGSSDLYLKNLHDDANWEKHYLTQNYRCAPNIIKFADNLITSLEKLSPPQEPVKTKNGNVDECTFGDALDELLWDGDWGNWFILCRTNDEVDMVLERLKKEDVPCMTFKRADLELEEMENMLKDNKVKVLTIHCCVSGDTLVPTTAGTITIEELVKKNDPSILVYNGNYYDRVEEFIKNGNEQVYKIKTSAHGYTIKVTANHEVIIKKGDKFEKVKAKDLKGDEILVINKGVPDVNTDLIRTCNPYDCCLSYNKMKEMPALLDENLAEFLGMISCDVFILGNETIFYCNERKDCVDRFADLIGKCFNHKVLVTKSMNTKLWCCQYVSEDVVNFLVSSFTEADGCTYAIDKILKSRLSVQKAYLKGIIEGSQINTENNKINSIQFNYINKNYQQKFQALLCNIGVIGDFYNMFDGTFSCVFKSNGLADLYNVIKPKVKELQDLIGDYINENEIVSTNTSYFFDTIDTIEPYRKENTYCLTMAHEPQFVQNGFIMGNSKGLESPNVIVVGAKLFNEDERKVSYVAATRAEQNLYWCPSIRPPKNKRPDFKKGNGRFNNVVKQMVKFDS